MKRYRLNKTKFAEFCFGLAAMSALTALLVWVTCAWIVAA